MNIFLNLDQVAGSILGKIFGRCNFSNWTPMSSPYDSSNIISLHIYHNQLHQCQCPYTNIKSIDLILIPFIAIKKSIDFKNNTEELFYLKSESGLIHFPRFEIVY
ncbi:hypothetical protein ACTFIV_006163 [Dictyostelium citrinum]